MAPRKPVSSTTAGMRLVKSASGKGFNFKTTGLRTLQLLATEGRRFAGLAGGTAGAGQRVAGLARRELVRRKGLKKKKG